MPYQLAFDPVRSDTAVHSCTFIQVFWCEFHVGVSLVSFLDIPSGCRFYLTCTSFCSDRVELSLSRTEVLYQIQVRDWEVPTPPVQSESALDGPW